MILPVIPIVPSEAQVVAWSFGIHDFKVMYFWVWISAPQLNNCIILGMIICLTHPFNKHRVDQKVSLGFSISPNELFGQANIYWMPIVYHAMFWAFGVEFLETTASASK